MSAQALSNLRTLVFGLTGSICAIYAFAALLLEDTGALPHWMPPAAGIAAAGVFFLAAAFAGRENMNASLDEGYRDDRRSAGVAGFWAAIVIGTVLWFGDLGGTLQLAITLTGASAGLLLAHVVLELRGRR